MKRIGNSKEPTIQRMVNMASNLTEKFAQPALIELRVSYLQYTRKPTVEFWLSLDMLEVREWMLTWPEVIARYRELMKDGLQ